MKRLTLERQKRNLSKAALGYKLEIHPSLIGKYESGVQRPYRPAQKKLEAFFGMSIDELLEEVD